MRRMMMKKESKSLKKLSPVDSLLRDLRELIAGARKEVAQAVNSRLVILYWSVGRRIRQDVLKGKRAEYGEEILPTLSAKLVEEFGRGFGKRNLFNMVRFAEAFPDPEIVSTLSRQLSWNPFVEIISLRDQLQRDFYAEMCRIDRWSMRALRKKIGGMLYERTALSRKPEKLIEQKIRMLREEDRLTPDLIFRDPYLSRF